MTLQKSKHSPILRKNFINNFSSLGEKNKKSVFRNSPNLSKNYYQKILTYDFILKQNYTSIMQLPRMEKIVLNASSKNYLQEKKNLLVTLAALECISGEKPQLTYAKKSVANFKIRQHQLLGCKIVLRENLMYAFLTKFSRILLPSLRDSLTPKEFLQRNQESFLTKKQTQKLARFIGYSFGLKNLMIFPELEKHFELVENFRGINFTFVVSHFRSKDSRNRQSADLRLLLSGFQIPIY